MSQPSAIQLVEVLKQKGITNAAVLAAMQNTPRHLFVESEFSTQAYTDHALPLTHQQTISQPYVVARMTELLLTAGPLNKILEIGTGSGYQAAVLAQLVKEVYSIERIHALYLRAKQRFSDLNYKNIHVHFGDGNKGWPAAAPFDGIIVTAAAPEIPDALLAQLADGGRMVIPVNTGTYQTLRVITRDKNNYIAQEFDAVVFVPLLSGTDRE